MQKTRNQILTWMGDNQEILDILESVFKTKTKS